MYNIIVSLSIICFSPVPPSIRGSDEVSSLTVIEGSLMTLVCESSGIPPPRLTWKKNGEAHHDFHHHHPPTDYKTPHHYPHHIYCHFQPHTLIISHISTNPYSKFVYYFVSLRFRAKGRFTCACSFWWAAAADFQC